MTDTWGEAIPIKDGKQPEFVKIGEPLQYQTSYRDDWYEMLWGWGWGCVGKAIRLPADHPYYRKPTMKIDDALVERMAALVRKLVDYEQTPFIEYGLAVEAREIAASLPKPVDPEKEAIREAMGWQAEDHMVIWENGHHQLALAAFRAGRAFERKNGNG